jgi:hypothetical protein
MKLDLDSFLSNLGLKDQEVCDAVRFNGVAGAAKKLGVHRGTIYRRLKSLAQQFEDVDLREYLK